MKLFKKVKEIKSRKGELHFERFAVIETSLFALYIHKIHKHDEDKHFHSHPWNFISMVLAGSYFALSPDGWTLKKPGTISYMNRAGFHKIEAIVKGPITTIFFTFGKHKPWYYLVDGVPVESTEYRRLKHENGW